MSDGYLLDTNVISALADRTRADHIPTSQRLAAIGNSPVLLPVMAIAEISFGMAKAGNVAPQKRAELQAFFAQYVHLPVGDGTVDPYSLVRAELWRLFATPQKRGHKERRAEDLLNKVTGKELGIDEPDLLIASVALEHNLILVTHDENEGMRRIKEASERIFQRREFPVQLRTENWSVALPGSMN
jgi:predicted nucleic acid-binding protein